MNQSLLSGTLQRKYKNMYEIKEKIVEKLYVQNYNGGERTF